MLITKFGIPSTLYVLTTYQLELIQKISIVFVKESKMKASYIVVFKN